MDVQTDLYYKVVLPFIEYSILALCLLAALALIGWLRQRRSDVMRETYEVFVPANKSFEDVVDLMQSWSSLPKPQLGKAIQAICLDRFSDYSGEHLYLTIAGRTSARIDELFYQHLDATLEPVEYDPIAETVWDKAVELALSGYNVPLRIGTATGVAGTFSAHLKNIPEGHSVCMQFVISAEGARTPTSEDRDKVKEHTFNVIVRLGAAGERAEYMVQDLISPFRSIESHGAKFRLRRLRQVSGRLNRRAATWGFSGLYNASELPPMIFRFDGTGAYKARRLAPSYVHQTEGIVLGYSNAPKMGNRAIAMPIEDGDTHVAISGKTGVGKSNLLLNMALQYIHQPDVAVLVLEPAGDLAWDIVRRIPAHRAGDVIFWNPLDKGYSIGLNPLADGDPERITAQVVSMLKSISGDSWSPTIDKITSAAINTAAIHHTTIYDAVQYLINPTLRAEALKRLPRSEFPDLRQAWDYVESHPDIYVDSSEVRIRQIMHSEMMRHTLSQQKGFDFNWWLKEHKILIVALPRLPMGPSNADGLGTLIRQMAWDAAMLQPMDNRQRSVVILDEYQNYSGDTLLSKSEPFSEARKFKQQYIIANQYQEQLPRESRLTVDRNVGTHITFQISPAAASDLKERYAPLDQHDLANLPKWTVAARIMSLGGLAPTVTFKTPPPPPETPYWGQIIDRTRKDHARPTAEVQAEISERHKPPKQKSRPKIGEIDE